MRKNLLVGSLPSAVVDVCLMLCVSVCCCCCVVLTLTEASGNLMLCTYDSRTEYPITHNKHTTTNIQQQHTQHTHNPLFFTRFCSPLSRCDALCCCEAWCDAAREQTFFCSLVVGFLLFLSVREGNELCAWRGDCIQSGQRGENRFGQLISPGAQPLTSQGAQPLTSQGAQPLTSQGAQPMTSQGIELPLISWLI